jgi:methionine-rich copper-binding protein CopC
MLFVPKAVAEAGMAMLTMRERARKIRKMSTLMVALLVGPPVPGALAETGLLQTTPAANSVVAAPDKLMLKFRNDIKQTAVDVSGPGRLPLATGMLVRNTNDSTLVTLLLPGSLKAGLYIIEWHAVAADGQILKGCYSFEIRS